MDAIRSIGRKTLRGESIARSKAPPASVSVAEGFPDPDQGIGREFRVGVEEEQDLAGGCPGAPVELPASSRLGEELPDSAVGDRPQGPPRRIAVRDDDLRRFPVVERTDAPDGLADDRMLMENRDDDGKGDAHGDGPSSDGAVYTEKTPFARTFGECSSGLQRNRRAKAENRPSWLRLISAASGRSRRKTRGAPDASTDLSGP